jgi:hypothetical protein
MNSFSIKKIEDGFVWLRNEFDNTGEIQSIDILIQKLDNINSCLAWAGEQMAIAKKLWNDAKLKAYHKLQMSSAAQEKYYAPSLAKEYVNSQCSNEEYNYDMAERFTRALVHIAENLRTAVSALKQQMLLESYTSNVPS